MTRKKEQGIARHFAARARGLEASTIREICRLAGIPGLVSLAGGWPNPDAFPFDFTAEAIGRLMAERRGEALQYGMSEGLAALREWLAGWLGQKEGIATTPDGLVVVAGAQMGMELTCRTFVEKGDVCLVDLPTYFGGVGSLQFYGAELVGVPTDGEGTDVDAMAAILARLARRRRRVKLAYVQSIHHNPLGVNLSPARRRALMALAGKYDFLVMEDCPYRDLCYAGEPELPLKSMDGAGRVVYVKSFAKIFSPGIRMAAVVADPEAAGKMVVARQFVDCCPSNLSQFLLLEFCRSGAMERHIDEMRRFYARRRDRMLAALDAHFPPEVRWTRPTGGFFVFAHLPGGMDAAALFQEAMAEKVAFVPGRQFYIDGSGASTLRLSFAQAPEDKIDGAVEVLGRLIRKRMGSKRGS